MHQNLFVHHFSAVWRKLRGDSSENACMQVERFDNSPERKRLPMGELQVESSTGRGVSSASWAAQMAFKLVTPRFREQALRLAQFFESKPGLNRAGRVLGSLASTIGEPQVEIFYATPKAERQSPGPDPIVRIDATVRLRGGPGHTIVDTDRLFGFLSPDQPTRMADAFFRGEAFEVVHLLPDGLHARVIVGVTGLIRERLQRRGNELMFERGSRPAFTLEFTASMHGKRLQGEPVADPAHIQAFVALKDYFLRELNQRGRKVKAGA